MLFRITFSHAPDADAANLRSIVRSEIGKRFLGPWKIWHCGSARRRNGRCAQERPSSRSYLAHERSRGWEQLGERSSMADERNTTRKKRRLPAAPNIVFPLAK